MVTPPELWLRSSAGASFPVAEPNNFVGYSEKERVL